MDVIGIEVLGIGGYGVRMTKIEDIVNKYSSVVVYDEISASVRAMVTIVEGQVNPVINGRTLTPGTYTFWYENEKSLTEKLKLINKYNLKGSGSWSLGQEPADTWKYYDKVVNNEESSLIQFKDVPSDYWAHTAIYKAKEKGWVNGRSAYFFEPEGTLTRAEFATLISRILGYTYQKEGDFYFDISNHWAKKEINAVTVAKLMDGYNNGLFWPDKPITREEVAKVIYFLVNDVSTNKEVNYLDVSEDRWSYQYIQKLSSLGIFNGYENGKFQPQSPIKRSEMVTVLDRIFSND